MDVVGNFSGSASVSAFFQIGETISNVGVPVVVGGAGNEGIALATTTSAANFIGLSTSTATLVTAQQSDSSETDRVVSVDQNPDMIIRSRLSGGATSFTALTVFTVTTASTTGLDVVTGDDFTNFDEGTICCIGGVNKGRSRKIVIGDATDATVGVAFPFDISVGDTFVALPFAHGEDQFVQLTSDLTQVDASVAVNTTNGNFRVMKFQIDDINNAFVWLTPADSFWINSTSVSSTGDTMTGTLTIDQDANAVSIDIDTEATTANGLVIAPTVMTTGNAIEVGDADALTTGKILNLVSNSADTGTRALIQVTNDNTLATGATPLQIQQDAVQRAAFIDQNAVAVALEIDTESTTANGLVIAPTVMTTGNAIDVSDADALTTGGIANFVSNSADTGTRALVDIINENTAATGATCLDMRQDAIAPVIQATLGTVDAGFMNFIATADGDATSAISTLTTSGAVTHHIQFEINGTTFWIAGSTTDPS